MEVLGAAGGTRRRELNTRTLYGGCAPLSRIAARRGARDCGRAALPLSSCAHAPALREKATAGLSQKRRNDSTIWGCAARATRAGPGVDLMNESPTEPFEHAEHAQHVAHSGDSFLSIVSISIAILAVLAATVGSLETLETAKAFGEKNAAVLLQSKASDGWAFYQAKSVKQNLYALAAEQGGKPEYADKARRYDSEQKEIEKQARDYENKSHEALEASETHEHRHHILTVAVTLLHVAIAIATISIIIRGRRWPWHGALLLGAAGTVGAIFAYI